MVDSRVAIVLTLALLLYFAWMDVALFYEVQSRTPEIIPDNPQTFTTVTAPVKQSMGSPFTGLSVKMMMMDQINNYIHTPLANIFNEVAHFSTSCYFITPNMISFIGLLFAFAAAKAITMESRAFHFLAVILFEIRTWMDALDGIVARSRIGMVQHASLRNTSGYVIDAAADTVGFASFLIGCFQYLRSAVPKQKLYLPLNASESYRKDSKVCNGSSHSPVPSSWTQRRIAVVVGFFGLQLAISAFFWDHYVATYHTLLETQPNSQSQANAQSEVLHSSITWVLMWFWRISNAHTLIEFLLYAICINKLWEFLLWIQYIGVVHILTLSLLTEIHVSTVQSYIIKSAS